jgi:hypothetical protein
MIVRLQVCNYVLLLIVQQAEEELRRCILGEVGGILEAGGISKHNVQSIHFKPK